MDDVFGIIQGLDYISRIVVFKMMRTMVLSVIIMLVILSVRKICDGYGRRHKGSQGIYVKAYMWLLLLPIPFMGCLKLSYEHFYLRNRVYVILYENFMGHSLPGIVYILGVLCAGGLLIYRKRKLRKWIRELPVCDAEVPGTSVDSCRKVEIRVTPLAITPFTTGVRKPVIVLPEYILREFEEEERERVLEHEYCHIRKGHLFLYEVLELFRVIWFPNPLVHYCIRKVKDDLEMVCDHAAICSNTYNPESYGMTLVKSLSFLQEGLKRAESHKGMPAFIGETSFSVMKKRIRSIAGYREYSKGYFRRLHMISAGIVLLIFIAGKMCSYPAYTPFEGYSLYSYNGRQAIFQDNTAFNAAIEEQESGLLVNNRKVEELFQNAGIENTGDYWIYYGGYMKFPGVGGGGDLVGYDMSEMTEETTFIPFNEREVTSSVLEWILKNI